MKKKNQLALTGVLLASLAGNALSGAVSPREVISKEIEKALTEAVKSRNVPNVKKEVKKLLDEIGSYKKELKLEKKSLEISIKEKQELEKEIGKALEKIKKEKKGLKSSDKKERRACAKKITQHMRDKKSLKAELRELLSRKKEIAGELKLL